MNNDERKNLMRSYLGKTVDIVIDRPLGSTHPKYHHMALFSSRPEQPEVQ